MYKKQGISAVILAEIPCFFETFNLHMVLGDCGKIKEQYSLRGHCSFNRVYIRVNLQ